MVGENRQPSVKDRSQLPYTEAVLMEIQRYANIIPGGVQHVCIRDLTVNDVTIPAGTLIQPQMTQLLKVKNISLNCFKKYFQGDYWGDGTTFRPERFIDESGNVKKDEHLIPFSIGKRQCLGETLAKVELFLFFTNLVHHFNFLPETEGELPSEEYSPGVTILPKKFKARLIPRA